ncbi:GPO family capsid scaffolding protein [Aeromonas hydrophila]|nr:GPO family capsid scaffolding protein [Aeromonas hydrophila]
MNPPCRPDSLTPHQLGAGMNESTLRTGWVCIATEGKAVDGRYYPRLAHRHGRDLRPDLYTAVIGRSTIAGPAMAPCRRSRPKRSMASTSCTPSFARTAISSTGTRAASIQFCSIEPFEQFADLGRTYLIGLGVTDPASTGTTHLKFSNSNKA